MAKVINFYRESVIPAVLVFRRSIDKNALKSVAIYGMSRYYTNLRVLSDYPDIFTKFSNKMRESACPPNGFKNTRTPARTLFFVDYSNRTKYKGMRSFSSSRDLNDLRFLFPKVCRRTLID